MNDYQRPGTSDLAGLFMFLFLLFCFVVGFFL